MEDAGEMREIARRHFADLFRGGGGDPEDVTNDMDKSLTEANNAFLLSSF